MATEAQLNAPPERYDCVYRKLQIYINQPQPTRVMAAAGMVVVVVVVEAVLLAGFGDDF